MVPDNVIWNYNFIGLGIVSTLKYTIVPGTPKDFYHESHRPAHFLRFIKSEENEEEEKVDMEDYYDWDNISNSISLNIYCQFIIS